MLSSILSCGVLFSISDWCCGVRLTDPEILERRYPVILNRFSLAPGSGGQGKFRGGEGVLRKTISYLIPTSYLFLNRKKCFFLLLRRLKKKHEKQIF
jgi:N-methylhydantoinase B/oxoprolinase/acetone carboxylase alpha subunit